MKKRVFLLILIVLMFIPNVKAPDTWGLLNEHWFDVLGWSKYGLGTSEINPSSHLHNEPDADTYVTRRTDIGTLPQEYTVEFYLQIDSFGSGANNLVRFDFYDGEHLIQFAIRNGSIGYVNSSVVYSWTSHTTNNDWTTWRLVCDSDSDSVNVYENQTLVATFTDLRNYALSDGYVYSALTENESGEDGCETHTDYLRIATGLYDFDHYITFYYNTGGILRVDNATITNATENGYENNTVIELVALVDGNLTYGFSNFTYDSSSNISNPFDLTVTQNLTVWCYFGAITGNGFSYLPLVILTGLGCALCFVFALTKT